MAQPIRTIFVCSAYHPRYAGASVYIHQFIPFLAKYDVQSRVLTRTEKGHPEFDYIDGTYVQRTGFAYHHPATNLATAFQFAYFLIRNRSHFDVVHFASGSTFAHICTPILRSYQIPVVIETVLFEADDAYRTSNLVLGKQRIWSMQQANAIFTISEALYDSYINHSFPPKKVKLLPYGINTKRFRPASHLEKNELRRKLEISIPDNAPVGIFIGGVNPRKGIDLLVDTWAKVCHQFSNALLLIVGPNDQSGYSVEFGQSIRKRLMNLGIHNNVQLCGLKSNTQDYLRISDIYLSASKNEGLGIAVLEGMSCGLVPITTYLPGISETLFGRDNDLSQMVVPNRDSDQFAEKIISLLGKKEMMGNLSKQAVNRIENEFDIYERARKFSEVYRNILS